MRMEVTVEGPTPQFEKAIQQAVERHWQTEGISPVTISNHSVLVQPTETDGIYSYVYEFDVEPA